jgi:hypothetical protein
MMLADHRRTSPVRPRTVQAQLPLACWLLLMLLVTLLSPFLLQPSAPAV